MTSSTGPDRRTLAVHGGARRSQYGEMSEAIFLTQSFVYDSAEQAEARFIECEDDDYIYARYGNPTVRMFEERMAAIEGVEDGFALASGMAAVSSSLCAILSAGDRLVASRALFGSCLYVVESMLPRFGVDVELVDGTDPDQWRRAVRPGTKAVFLETVSNPMLEVIDLAAVSQVARHAGAVVVVDNALSTPLYQCSAELGADVIIYSSTKHVDGQGRCLGGIVLGTKDFIRKTLEPHAKHTGGALSPFNAWVMLKSLETLTLRCEHQTEIAHELAASVEGHAKVLRVLYPKLESHPQFAVASTQMTGGGTVFTMELTGGREGAFRFINALRLFRISNNFGDSRSIVTHPASTTHQRIGPQMRQQLGINDGVVRISVGLEEPTALRVDLEQALDAV